MAARYTFRRLFLAGLTALLADAVGFAVLMVIDIAVIKDLALTASLGVAVLIFTNLILLPVLLSYVGVSERAAARTLKAESDEARNSGFNRLFGLLARFVERRWALAAVVASAALLAGGYLVSTQLKIGDLDPGAPELRADSRYNRDNAYITSRYSLSSDTFAVIVKTEKEGCLKYQTLVEADRLAWSLAAGARRADHRGADQRGAPDHRRQQRGRAQVADHRAQPGRAELRRAAGQRQQPGPVQQRLLGDAGDRLPVGPPRRNAGPRRRSQQRVRGRAQHPRAAVPAGGGIAPASRLRPTSSCARPGCRCCCWCMPR